MMHFCAKFSLFLRCIQSIGPPPSPLESATDIDQPPGRDCVDQTRSGQLFEDRLADCWGWSSIAIAIGSS